MSHDGCSYHCGLLLLLDDAIDDNDDDADDNDAIIDCVAHAVVTCAQSYHACDYDSHIVMRYDGCCAYHYLA